MAIQSKLELKRYQFDIDVRKKHHIYGKNDKVISFGEWIRERTCSCIIVEMKTDIGCRNVLVFKLDPLQPKNSSVKITDFGLARSLKTPSKLENLYIIPKRYCALEILRNNDQSSYTEKSDVYSMGVLMWEALSNSEIPYSYIADDNLVARVKLDNEKLNQPPICNPQLWSLIESCWDDEPVWRPNFEQIIDRLTYIKPSKVSDVRPPITSYEPSTGYTFKLNVDVAKNGLLDGRFRETYEAQWLSERTESIVLIKMNEAPTKYELLFYKEFNNHPHIIKTFGFVENNLQSIMLLQERAPHGHLQELLKNNLFEPTSMVLVAIFLQIMDAMMYVINQGMIHGDLRCSNILVFQMDASKPKENFVKLTNFALVRPNQPLLSEDRRLIIPVEYCAPEILRSAGRLNYCELSEVYSMGVLMWEACSQGKLPYGSSISNREIRQKKLDGEILPRPWMCDRRIWPNIKKCWNNKPQSRIKFKDMKIQLSNLDLESQYQFKLGIDVKMNDRLHSRDGQIYYNAEWIRKNTSSIILILINRETAEHEASFYLELSSHKYIVHTFGLVKNDPRSTMLIQERAPHGNLLKLLQSQQFKPSTKILKIIFLQIIDAMIYIIDQDLIHGDLRCASVLVFEMNPFETTRNLVKLTNFSFTCRNDPSFKNDRQTLISIRYAAPEIVQSRDQFNYSEFSDVYSMGVLMWEACSQGKMPYGVDTYESDIRRRKSNDEILPMPNACDEQLWEIIKGCWYITPEIRHTFKYMKKLLSRITFESLETCEYQLDVHVIKKNPLNGLNGRYYEADWIPKREPPIILMIMNKETSECEASWYFKLNVHKHIIHTYGFVRNNDRLPMLLQERAIHGNLQILLQRKRFQPSNKVLITIFLQILDAMMYITDLDIAHGNLCCSNVLVFRMHPTNSTENLVKLTDFSMARTKDCSNVDVKQTTISVRYCAPEILKSAYQSNYFEASDVYSFGVLMWEACSHGTVPYGSDTSIDNIRQRRLNGEQLLPPDDCDARIWTIITQCLLITPEIRDTMEQIQLELLKIDYK
ncbi:unnamed protein product [Rotaria sp. Silwood1]|nr:unnamed protein product [Rotaria sp. Silwood1]